MPSPDLLDELVLLADARTGLTPLAALRAATLYPAQFLGATERSSPTVATSTVLRSIDYR